MNGNMTVFKVWLLGLIAAFVAGFAGAISNALGNMAAMPEVFNMGNGALVTLKASAIAGLISGVIGAAAYLVKSPVPQLFRDQ